MAGMGLNKPNGPRLKGSLFPYLGLPIEGSYTAASRAGAPVEISGSPKILPAVPPA